MTGQHEPSNACATIHCHSHHVDEPGPGHIICGECGHVYRTAGELRRAYRREVVRGLRFAGPGDPWLRRLVKALAVRARDIRFCQECIHDF